MCAAGTPRRLGPFDNSVCLMPYGFQTLLENTRQLLPRDETFGLKRSSRLLQARKFSRLSG